MRCRASAVLACHGMAAPDPARKATFSGVLSWLQILEEDQRVGIQHRFHQGS